MTNFYTGDLHFYHSNIIKYENRPFKNVDEMNKVMVEKWNAKVTKQDNVFIIGDFAFSTPDQAIDIASKLNGKKHLIFGNHDKVVRNNKLVRECFEFCKEYHVVYENDLPIILFHYPIAVWDRKHYGSLHLYGHVHSNKGDHHPLLVDLKNAYNVGTDVWNFEPVTLQEILGGKFERSTN